jgi:hypothetical protein
MNLLKNIFFLGAVALPVLMGCQKKESGSLNNVPAGIWKAAYGDYFVITPAALEYVNPDYPIEYLKGTIRHIQYFNETAGVMIIEYSEGGRPQYYEYGGPPDYEIISGPHEPLGNFRGIYLTKITGASIDISAADDPGDRYSRSEKTTLEAAKAGFTLDNLDFYVTSPAAYKKQAQQ